MKEKMKKAQIEFAWIFAVIVGTIILFFAFYFVGTKLLSQKYEETTVEAQSLDILLNPFSQLGEIAAATATPLALQQPYNLTLECINNENIGYNEITLSKKGTTGISRIVYDKYIFVEQNLETKKFQAISMPFEMPWRVADIIILWPYDKKYCFKNAPTFVKEKLGNETTEGLNIPSIYFDSTSYSSCPEDATKVCFGTNTNCDIKVQITNTAQKFGSTTKEGKTIYFASEALMYASIFSDPEIYKCNVQRLASRLYFQTSVYEEKAITLSQRGCSASFNLLPLKTAAENIVRGAGVTSDNLQSLSTAAQTIKQQNEIADCDLF